MTVTDVRPEIADEVERAGNRLAKATAAYMARLKDIADITTLSTGSHGYDYAVTVRHKDKPALLPLLADLTFEIEDLFGVKITTLAVAGATRKLKPNSGTVMSKVVEPTARSTTRRSK